MKEISKNMQESSGGLLSIGGVFTSGMLFGGSVTPELIMLVKTDNAGTSTSTQFTLPVSGLGTLDYSVDWGDGSSDDYTTTGAKTHTYSSSGTYEIKITGQFGALEFNNGGDRLKLLEISNWGTGNTWETIIRGFFGCANLNITATDTMKVAASGARAFNAFRACPSLISIPKIDTSNIADFVNMFLGDTALTGGATLSFASATNINGMLSGAVLFNAPLDNITSACTSFNQTLNNADEFDQDISGWDVSGITAGTQQLLLSSDGFSTANYDALLIAWGAQTVNSGVAIDFGTSTYTSGGAAEAGRASLASQGWTITDGGAA